MQYVLYHPLLFLTFPGDIPFKIFLLVFQLNICPLFSSLKFSFPELVHTIVFFFFEKFVRSFVSQGLKVVLGFASIVIPGRAISCILLNYFKIYNLLV